jgi:protein-S-isoprenylcysteine O-methyltransferase Ste14
MAVTIEQNTGKDSSGLDRYGRRGIIMGILIIFITLIILLISAGQFNWINAWVLAGLYLALTVVYSVVLIKKDPQLLNERGKFMKRETKTFDKFFYVFWRPLSIATLIIAGFDAVRYGWSHMSLIMNILGFMLSALGCALTFWAMAVNTHFEAFVRIQMDRGHHVCAYGPYKAIRHPGYLGSILTTLGMPLILGSWWAVLPSVAIVFLLIFRTAMEDLTIKKALPGYKEYTETTQHRLIPLLW